MLTDKEIKSTKAKEKPYKLADQKGLYLYILPTGFKSWRYDYKSPVTGKRPTYVYGEYPSISLAEARLKHLEVKAKLAKGIDPREEEKEQKQAQQAQITNTFKTIALEWYNNKIAPQSAKHAKTVIQRLEKDIFPAFGDKDINSITKDDLLTALRGIEARGAIPTAKKVRGICDQIYRYAISLGRANYNFARDIAEALQKNPASKHYAYITDPKEFGKLLRDIDKNVSGNILIRLALQIMPYVFVRANEFMGAEWKEIDFNRNLWTIPAVRMKMKASHVVPLAPQVVTLFKKLHQITGQNQYIFHNYETNKPYSKEYLLHNLRYLGYDNKTMSIHGFRHSASTFLYELGYDSHHIEKQLAHEERNKIKGTYNHAEYLKERTKMMYEYANYLDDLRKK